MAVVTQSLPKRVGPTYVAVAASQTLSTLASRRGCHLVRLIIQPESTSPGNVIVYDGDGSSKATVYTFPGGSSSVADLAPIVVEFSVNCKVVEADQEGWYVTTGANVNVVAICQET